ncbi:MAG: RdgB/HAM1 family non-canonical purine NTP pyrophosphatase [Propionibacteriaceae bacterium]|jgi:XTP/dITP diphosphohydrolase|nr:RdgB/HAM1 family non-canonical purine NTP pyrophosphatase [Propionibacteriaceae bacterium]
MTILLASGSAHKVAEVRRILETAGVTADIVGLGDVSPYPEPVEDGATFEDNALIKARAGFAVTGLPTLADDSGIEVDVLNRMPGVRSARWAGGHADDQANLDLLVRQVADVAAERRGARFVCTMALVWSGGERVVRGVVEGSLATAPRGERGFGYDPLFVPRGETRTTAELSDTEKDAISHRGRAVRAMAPYLTEVGE